MPAVFYALLLIILILIQLPPSAGRDLLELSYIFRQLDFFKTFIVVGASVVAVFDVIAHEQKLRRKFKRSHRKKADTR